MPDGKLCLRVLNSDSSISKGEGAGHILELWNMVDQVRRLQDSSLDINVQPEVESNSATLKSGELEAILLFIGLAMHSAKPAMQFIIDLTKELGKRKHKKLKIKTKTGEFLFEGEDSEEYRNFIAHSIETIRKEDSHSSKQLKTKKVDMEILIEGTEGRKDAK